MANTVLLDDVTEILRGQAFCWAVWPVVGWLLELPPNGERLSAVDLKGLDVAHELSPHPPYPRP